ncbi:MAG: hypothetical protein JZU72_03035 [Chlorobium phaeobacteroides]|nr:hypothetical protein [Chlorobium phaeobacteroides]
MSPTIREPLFSPALKVKETEQASFADLIRLVAESVADAQAALDRSSASLLRELAETPVEIIPSITETISQGGEVTYKHGKPRTVSLLDLGVMPTFYQFSQTVIEIQMDLKITEATTESGTRKGLVLLADTAAIRFERKLDRDVKIVSKITATLVPVPMPLRIEPVRSTENA